MKTDDKEKWEELMVEQVPSGSLGTYMSSKTDDFVELMRGKKGPFGYKPVAVQYHLIVWNGKVVWVSSEDAILVPET